jgi:hypothetical protein
MPDSGSDRGRSSTRSLVATILAGTEWAPAETPQDATHTAREARDLAVRLRPVLSKLAQQPRGGRRRDLEWLPAVEQLAVDAQYFASWWLPRLEGKSAGSWPSWSADGYADWVKRLDAQRLRTLEMVQGTAPAGKLASVTPLKPRSAPEEPEPDPQADEPDAEEVSAEAELPSVPTLAPLLAPRVPHSPPNTPSVVNPPSGSDPAGPPSSKVPHSPPISGPPKPRTAPRAPVSAAGRVERPAERPAPGSVAAASLAGAGRAPLFRDERSDLDLLDRGAAGPPSTPPPPPSPPAQTADVGRIVRYVTAAVLFAAGLVLVLYATHKKSPTDTGAAGHPVTTPPAASPAATSQSSAGGAVSAPTASGDPGTATSAAGPAPEPTSTAPKSSAAPTTQGANQGSTKPSTAVTSNAGAGTAVTSLAVSKPTPDQSGSTTYGIHIIVRTTGTGPVTVTVTVAGSSVSGSPGTVGATTFTVSLSGHTSYDVPKLLDDHPFCPAPYLGVQASAPGAAPVYADATSGC